MSVTIRLEGAKELQTALRNLSDEVREQVGKAVTGTAIMLRADVVERIQRGPASGVVYTKKNPNRVHQASAPGEAPATDTGRLANSIEFDQVGPLTATVGSRLIYALYLEYGTSRMAPRPYFRPAVEAVRPKFERALERALAGVIK